MTTTTTPGTTITGIDIAVHLTGDAKLSVAFYRDVLGLVPSEVEDRGAEFELADGSTFGVWTPDEEPKKGVTLMFAVADLPAALALFRSRGAQLSDPDETPVCFMAFGQDPDGNAFILHQRKVAAG